MTWERPGALWLLALAVPVVLLHLRWRRRREAQVPSLALWRGLGPAGAGRRGLRSVQDALQLALLLAALAAFTAALAGPGTGRPPAPAQRLSIVLDVSASMNARDGDRTRFDAARAAAIAALDRLGPGDDVVVWAAGSPPRVEVEPTRDLAAARRALESMRPTLEPCSVAETADLARRALGPESAALLVLTDPTGWLQVRGPFAGDPRVSIGVAGGVPVRDAGIVAVSVDETDGRVRVRAARFAGPEEPRELVLTRGGEELARVPAPLDGVTDATLPLAPLGGRAGVAEVRLVPPRGVAPDDLAPDDFAPNDFAAFVVAGSRPLAVAVDATAASHRFVTEALRAMPELVDADRAVAVGRDAPAASLAAIDVFVASVAPPANAPPGRPVLLFDAPGRRVADPLLWGVGTHPVLAGADLSPLRIAAANVLDVGPGERALVECAEGPVVVAGETDGVRRVRIGFAADASTLPLEPAFPVLVRNALRWLARPPALPPVVRAGAPLVASEPLGAPDRVWIEGPGALPARPVRVLDGRLAEPAPLPLPEGDRVLRVRASRGELATAVLWVPPDGFLAPPPSPAAPAPSVAAAALPDRRGNADTRRRFDAACALAGAAALAVGALLLGAAPRRNVDPVPPGA